MNVWCARILAEAARASRNGFYSQPIDIETERLSLHKGGVVQPQPGIWPSTNPNIYPGVVTPNITPWVITSGTSTSSGTSATTTGTYTSPNTTTVSALFNFPDDDIPELT